jgi:diguanylate cyclase (GGDEF)-like protein
MELDNRTLLIVVAFAAAVQTAALLYVWRMQLRERSVGLMALGFSLVTLGVVLIAARPALPVFLTIVVGNTAIIVGQAMNSLAIGNFAGRRISYAFPASLGIVTAALMAVFSYALPSIGTRIVLISILVPVSLWPAVSALLTAPPGPWRRTYWPLAGVFIFHGAFALGRGLASLIGGSVAELFAGSVLTALWFLESFAAVNLVALGLILMISQRLQLELDRQASYDGLTMTLNRRAFERIGEAEWSRSTRHDLPLSVLVLDLDGFKILNDTHGHDAGDMWLKTFAELCRGLFRREDLLCRFGGEEFIALLPQTPLEAAVHAAERARRAVEGLRVTHGGVDIAATVSIGVATRGPSVTDLKSAIAAADRALYRAKAAGRNRVVVDDGT